MATSCNLCCFYYFRTALVVLIRLIEAESKGNFWIADAYINNLSSKPKNHKTDRIFNKPIILRSMQEKKVLVFLAKAFETMEFSVFVDVLGWARVDYGHNLPVDTCGFTEKVISTFNVPVIVDKTIDEINVGEYDALAIPGGFGEFGFYEEAYDERFLKLIREFNAKGKIIASICSGAFPVAKSGVLMGQIGRAHV